MTCNSRPSSHVTDSVPLVPQPGACSWQVRGHINNQPVTARHAAPNMSPTARCPSLGVALTSLPGSARPFPQVLQRGVCGKAQEVSCLQPRCCVSQVKRPWCCSSVCCFGGTYDRVWNRFSGRLRAGLRHLPLHPVEGVTMGLIEQAAVAFVIGLLLSHVLS